jgi:SAM-dependent methyltransferase
LFYKGERMAATSPNSDLHGYGDAIRRELGRRIPRERELRVLDVGTGFGINVGFLTGWLARGSEVWTVDPSREVIANVEAGLDAEGARVVRFAVATADQLPFEDGFFDAVVSVMVLHHLDRLEPALEEMERVLKPGGTLLVVDYKPEASRRLEFKSLHKEEDFFAPDAVARGMGRLGVRPRATDFGVWFLVEGEARASARPGAGRAGRARGPAARGRGQYTPPRSAKRVGSRSPPRRMRRDRAPKS